MPGEISITVKLPEEIVSGLGEAVEAGIYTSIDEAVRIGVEMLEADKMIEGIGVERLRAMVREGAESGPSIDGEQVFSRLIAKYERVAEERGE